MLQEFLSTLGSVTGKTYSPKEFGQLVREALNADKKTASKATEKTEDGGKETADDKASEKKDENKNSKK